MSYGFPTVAEFKSQFTRDFPYAVPAWGALGSISMVAGVITLVTVTVGGRGYAEAPSVAVVDRNGPGAGATFDATVANGKVTAITVVAGGTGYVDPVLVITGGAGDDTDLRKVTDDDIDGASIDAQFNVNQDLFDTESEFKRAFAYLQAHMLVEKIAAATQGLGSQYNWITVAKSVGNVSESFQVPSSILDNPMLAAFGRTRYGALYLQIIAPMLVGNMMTTFRQSLP